jgi:hydroxyproline O-arabinosyltransferase
MKTGFFFVVMIAIGSCMATYTILTSLVPEPTITPESSHVDSIDPVVSMPEEIKNFAIGPLRPFHVALTATADPYSRWQCRIMYYWYKAAKARPQGSAEMGGFTRVLHSGKPDGLMDEIPTFVVDPLPPGMDRVSILSCKK